MDRHDSSIGSLDHGTSAPSRRLLAAVRDEEVGIDLEARPEAGAGRAGAVGRVEAEVARLELVHREPVVRAGEPLRVAALLELRLLAVPGHGRDDDDPLAEPERRLDAVGEAGRVGVRDRDARRVERPAGRRIARRALGRLGVPDDVAVDDDLDRVALVAVERPRVGQVHRLAVDPDPDEALPAGPLEDPVALGLAVLHERAEDDEPGPLGQGEDLVDDLLDRLALDLVAVRAVRVADAREEQPEMVVDLGDGPDGRARVARGALLVDRDGRREPVDLVDVGLLHLAEELAGVGAQALDVAALALGVDRVEGEARLAAPGQAGDDDEPVAREGDRDVLEVVFAGTANEDPVLRHRPPSLPDSSEQNRCSSSGRVAGQARRVGPAGPRCSSRSSVRPVPQPVARRPAPVTAARGETVEAQEGRARGPAAGRARRCGARCATARTRGLHAGHEARVAGPDEPAGEDHLDVAADGAESGGWRRWRRRRSRRRAARRSQGRPRPRPAAAAKTSGGSSRSRSSWIRCR